MEFDKSRVYTALNADEVKPGSKVIVADTIYDLRRRVEDNTEQYLEVLKKINSDDCEYRFHTIGDNALCYLVSEPKEPRRMTNRELAKWLAQGNGQCMFTTNAVGTAYSYGIFDGREIPDGIMIRGWDETEWHEPIVQETDE